MAFLLPDFLAGRYGAVVEQWLDQSPQALEPQEQASLIGALSFLAKSPFSSGLAASVSPM